MNEGRLSLRNNSVSFQIQNNALRLPVAEPDGREIKYCTKGIDNTERVSINGTCIEITSICEGDDQTDQMVRTKIIRISLLAK